MNGLRMMVVASCVLVIVGMAGTDAWAATPTGSDARAPVLSPPPAWFDPSVVRFVGSRYGDEYRVDNGVYVGGADGSDLALAEGMPDGATWGLLASDGRIVLVVRERAPEGSGRRWRRPLLVVEADGKVRRLAQDVSIPVLDADRDTAYAFRGRQRRQDGQLVGRPLWRFPLDGSRPTRVLPGGPLEGGSVVVSPDERRVATGSDSGTTPLRLRLEDGEVRRLGSEWPGFSSPGGEPYGFDLAGRLIRNGPEGPVRYDPDTGRSRSLLPRGGDIVELHVTPSGRHLVVLMIRRRAEHVLVVDLVDGDRREYAVPGGNDLDESGGDRYVVLRRLSDDIDQAAPEAVIVIDLLEGWIGELPWRGPTE